MKSTIRNLLAILKNNWGLKLSSFMIAFLLWLFVTNNSDPIRSMTISNVPITILNEDSIADIGKVVELQGSGTVTIKVTERRSVLNRLSRSGSNFRVEANLENINEMNAVPLSVTCDNSQVSWDEIAISPASLKVSLEDKTEQAFPVTITTSGEPMDGYSFNHAELTNEKTVLIAGPESLVNIIDQVTAPVSLAGKMDDITIPTYLRIYDKNGSEFTEAQMKRLEIKDSQGNILEDDMVHVDLSLWKVQKEVPIRIVPVGTPADGYYVREIIALPSAVNLKGSESALQQMGNTFTVNDQIDVTERSESFSTEINLKDTLENMNDIAFLDEIDPIVSVEVSIEHSGDRTMFIPLSSVELLNKPEKKKLVFTPADRISLMIHSELVDVQLLSEEDIHVSIDLADCEKDGTYDIPVNVTLPENCELSNQISVKVSSMSPDEEASSEKQ